MTKYQEGNDTGYMFALGFHDGNGNVSGNKGLVLLAVPENTVVQINTVFIPSQVNSNPDLNLSNGRAEVWLGQGGDQSGTTFLPITEIPISELYAAYLQAPDNYTEIKGYTDPGVNVPGDNLLQLNKNLDLPFGNGTTLTMTLSDLKLDNALYYISQPDGTVAGEMASTNYSLPIFDAATYSQIPDHLSQVVTFAANNSSFNLSAPFLVLKYPGVMDDSLNDLIANLNTQHQHGGPIGSPYAKSLKINGVTVPPVSVEPLSTSTPPAN